MQKHRSIKDSLAMPILTGLPILASFFSAAPAQAQAIPPAPLSGIYAQQNQAASGVLGQAIDEASSGDLSPALSSESGTQAKDGSKLAAASSANTSSASPENSSDPKQSLERIKFKEGQAEDEESRLISQAVDNSSSASPVDLAPVKLPERTRAVFNTNTFQTGILYKLPSRMFFQSSTENSLRLETNVLQTYRNNRADMIYRVLPNVTVGYALTKTTRASLNYFYFRDQYTRNKSLLSRNIHSIGFQLNQDIPINDRTAITLGFMGRQLLLSRFQPLSDLLPSVQVTRRVGGNTVLYGGILGQIRFRNTLGKFQEGDQFYTLGAIYRTPRWQFLWDNTFITNFGNRRLRFGPDNANMIMTLEADYRVSPKLPLVAFVRAQPIFNIGANQAIGFAGFNFRIFGGLRVDLNKAPIFPVKISKRK